LAGTGESPKEAKIAGKKRAPASFTGSSCDSGKKNKDSYRRKDVGKKIFPPREKGGMCVARRGPRPQGGEVVF